MPSKYVAIQGVATFLRHPGPTTLPERPPDLSRGEIVLCIHHCGGNSRNFDELAASHRHFEIFPLVYSDYSLVLSIDETSEDVRPVEVSSEEEASIGSVMGLVANAAPAERREMFNSVGVKLCA